MSTFEELIERKRDGAEHSADEIERIVLDYAVGDVPDYQMAAWLMASYLQGLSPDETVAMTGAMVRSGETLDLSGIPGTKVDKHSTGGVADTTTLPLVAIIASCGIPIAKMSGRGLGFTGGTLDKLESIPGYRTELAPEELVAQVLEVGAAVVAQSARIVPADRKIYALRDVTATVPSIPLIVSSVISKKIAGGADAVLIDVKVGSGAFMRSESEAEALGRELMRVGRALGKDIRVAITDMSQPLGASIGNALEVREALEVLQGGGTPELSEVVRSLGARLLVMGGVADDVERGRVSVDRAIDSGRALHAFESWVAAQGGDPRIVRDPGILPLAPRIREVRASRAGMIAAFDTEAVGHAAMLLGAGRQRATDAIDPGAGIVLAVRAGDVVERGDLIARLYSAEDALLDVGEARFAPAVRIGDAAGASPRLVRDLEM